MILLKYLTQQAKDKCKYSTIQSAGLDLIMDFRRDPAFEDTSIYMKPGALLKCPTGVALESIPEGYMAEIRTKSGLASKRGLIVLNSPGTIDADYTGEIYVLLKNSSSIGCVIHDGTYIAQLVIVPYARVDNANIQNNTRGSLGFGEATSKMSKGGNCGAE